MNIFKFLSYAMIFWTVSQIEIPFFTGAVLAVVFNLLGEFGDSVFQKLNKKKKDRYDQVIRSEGTGDFDFYKNNRYPQKDD